MKALVYSLSLLVVLAACSQPNPEAEAALAEKKAHAAKHAIVDSVANAYLNTTDPAKAGAMYAEGAMIYSPDYPNGKLAAEALPQMVEQMKAMSDWKNTSKVMFSHHDGFAIAATMSAKYNGPANPMNPKSPMLKDAPMGGPWVAVVKVNDAGKITEEHIQWDNMAMMQQMEAAAKKK